MLYNVNASTLQYKIAYSGLELLQAKTASEMTALQVSQSNEISQFIKFELTKLQSAGRDEDMPRPSQEAYNKVLSKSRRKHYVPMPECEKYLFFVSMLLQVYIRENVLISKNSLGSRKKLCTNCIADVGCLENISHHLTNLEQHVKTLSGKQNLSQLCQLYLTSMKLCIPYVV